MSDRITPAWAGKSVKSGNAELVHQDHPRMGGEKVPFQRIKKPPRGSPPHGRGKGEGCPAERAEERITPAWAGKRCALARPSVHIEDHPRMGGEKKSQTTKKVKRQGSPPHGRGKAFPILGVCVLSGITPAWAGKRGTNPVSFKAFMDHPRMGGEKPIRLVVLWLAGGSPPHGRGKGCKIVQRKVSLGITPAWAGKRWRASVSPS